MQCFVSQSRRKGSSPIIGLSLKPQAVMSLFRFALRLENALLCVRGICWRMIASMRLLWQIGRLQGASKYFLFRKLVECISKTARYSFAAQPCFLGRAPSEVYPLPTCMYSKFHLDSSTDRIPTVGGFDLSFPGPLWGETTENPEPDQEGTTRGWYSRRQIAPIKPGHDSA